MASPEEGAPAGILASCGTQETVQLDVGASVEVLQTEECFTGLWLPAVVAASTETEVLCNYTQLELETSVHVWVARERVRTRTTGSFVDTVIAPSEGASCCVPAWADLGMEVEGCDMSPGFEGAFAAGELLEWLLQPPESAAAAAFDSIDVAPAESLTPSKCKGGNTSAKGKAAKAATGPKVPHRGHSNQLAPTGPWARVQTRVRLPPSPYSPTGRLVTERCIPLHRLRPRPPPPPADFLCSATYGAPLQMRYEGMWWDATLVGVCAKERPSAGSAHAHNANDALHAGDEENERGKDSSDGHLAASVDSGAKITKEHGVTREKDHLKPPETQKSPAQQPIESDGHTQLTPTVVPRYTVVCNGHPDISAVVDASSLRPRWYWSHDQWSIENNDYPPSSACRVDPDGDSCSQPSRGAVSLLPRLPSACASGACVASDSTVLATGMLNAAPSHTMTTSDMGCELMAEAGKELVDSPCAEVAREICGRPLHEIGTQRGLRGLGIEEVAGSRMRVWTRNAASLPGESVGDTAVEIALALAYIEGCGISAQFDDGVYWVEGHDAFEWMAPDEEDRPAGLHKHTAETRRRASMHDARVRVWLPVLTGERLSRVGTVLEYSPKRGLRVQVADRVLWVGNTHQWRWVKPKDPVHAAELCALPEELAYAHDCGLIDKRGARRDAQVDRSVTAALSDGVAAQPAGSSGTPQGHSGTHVTASATTEIASWQVSLQPGTRVELWGRDEGFEGSWFTAEVLQVEGKRARVAIDELLEEGTPAGWEWHPPGPEVSSGITCAPTQASRAAQLADHPEPTGTQDTDSKSGTMPAMDQHKMLEPSAGAPRCEAAAPQAHVADVTTMREVSTASDAAQAAPTDPEGACTSGVGDAAAAAVAKDGHDYRLREWWPIRRLRPMPPPTPKGFSEKFKVGDEVNIYVEDAWWDVRVLDGKKQGTKPGDGLVAVEYALAGKIHVVPRETLRPSWIWKRGEWLTWHAANSGLYKTIPEHGDHAWVVAQPKKRPSEQSTTSPSKAHNGHKRTKGPEQADVCDKRQKTESTNGRNRVERHVDTSDKEKKIAYIRTSPKPQAHQVAFAHLKASGRGDLASLDGSHYGAWRLPAPYDLPLLLFPSEDVARGFVHTWCDVANVSFDGTCGTGRSKAKLDRSTREIMDCFPQGAKVQIRVSREDNVLGLPIGDQVSAVLISLDSVRGLLLHPPHPLGTLFTPSRLASTINSGGKWKQSVKYNVANSSSPPMYKNYEALIAAKASANSNTSDIGNAMCEAACVPTSGAAGAAPTLDDVPASDASLNNVFDLNRAMREAAENSLAPVPDLTFSCPELPAWCQPLSSDDGRQQNGKDAAGTEEGSAMEAGQESVEQGSEPLQDQGTLGGDATRQDPPKATVSDGGCESDQPKATCLDRSEAEHNDSLEKMSRSASNSHAGEVDHAVQPSKLWSSADGVAAAAVVQAYDGGSSARDIEVRRGTDSSISRPVPLASERTEANIHGESRQCNEEIQNQARVAGEGSCVSSAGVSPASSETCDETVAQAHHATPHKLSGSNPGLTESHVAGAKRKREVAESHHNEKAERAVPSQ